MAVFPQLGLAVQMPSGGTDGDWKAHARQVIGDDAVEHFFWSLGVVLPGKCARQERVIPGLDYIGEVLQARVRPVEA